MTDHTEALYAFFDAFFVQLRAAGVHRAVISPGYRSAPLAVSADRAGLEITVQIDERSAGFFALGIAKARREAVALICTSGTAAANYFPAVIEANRSAVPLIVLTADRPPELRGWGSNQTIDQVRLYGSNPRWFAELPVASEVEPDVASHFAVRAVAEAMSSPAGPVHLNFPVRWPLTPSGSTSSVSLATTVRKPNSVLPSDDTVADLAAAMAHYRRGLIIAGALNPGSFDVRDVLTVAARSRWPVIAEPVSQLRVADRTTEATVISSGAHLAGVPGFTSAARPEVLVLIGAGFSSASLRRWVESCDAERVFIIGDGPEWNDDSFTATDFIRHDVRSVFGALVRMLPALTQASDWEDFWIEADLAASEAIRASLIRSEMFGGRVVTALAGALPDKIPLFVGNSMAVRDFDLFWPRQDELLSLYSNRGASGIDGVISTALGVAAGSARPVVAVLGDLSFLHDLGGLLAAARLELPLVTVVIDNGGGGIFSLLPIADLDGAVRFDELFRTPHLADIGAISAGLGLAYHRVENSTDLQSALLSAIGSSGPVVIEISVAPAASSLVHQNVALAVSEAVAEFL